MASVIDILLCFHMSLHLKLVNSEPRVRVPASKGELWPAPHIQEKDQDFWAYEPAFQFVSNRNCTKLELAAKRYKTILDDMFSLTKPRNAKGRRKGQTSEHDPDTKIITTLKLELRYTKGCDDYPPAAMDEGYGMLIGDESRLHAQYIWGLLRGLESFTQMFYLTNNYTEMLINGTLITDGPEYYHRGVMINTGKHFLSLESILTTIDALEMNKMNVLHWRLTDDESFPYKIFGLEDLAKKGAFFPGIHYEEKDITAVINYASLRGIRVIPEIAMPGHVASIALAFPFMNSKCYDGEKLLGYGPLNIVNRATYRLLKQIIVEVAQTFPDIYIHLSCNDINFDCWLSDPKIKQFLEKNKMKSSDDLLAVFLATMLEILSGKKGAIVWQEPTDAGIHIPEGTVQVWKDSDSLNSNLDKGYPVIFSTCWSVKADARGVYWEDFYACDPEALVVNSSYFNKVLGGEALFWASDIDDSNIMSKLWPATCAVAERLWSTKDVITETLPRSRMEEQVCRMLRRGIQASPPNGPGNCFYRRTKFNRTIDTQIFSQQTMQPKHRPFVVKKHREGRRKSNKEHTQGIRKHELFKLNLN